ncbi:MAG: rhomboid family intramembrane serine protease [Deltaproteobacteria bacterium]|nr:rhomboid family intramembrane serine protease [Deltaproteobacteria bacterium]
MFLPIGDSPNPHHRPLGTLVFIGINAAVFVLVTLPLMQQRPDFNDPLLMEYLRVMSGWIPVQDLLAQLSAYDLFLFEYGFRPAAPSLTALVTSLFLHGGFAHLAGNMLFLWIFGDNVEGRLGLLGYALLYFGGGIAATIFFSLFVPGSQIPMVGASGAISAVLGCYFIWFPANRIKVFVFLFPILMQTVEVPARIVLGFYLLVDNLIPFLLTSGEGSGVAYGAHIGGFLAGLGVAWLWERRRWFR